MRGSKRVRITLGVSAGVLGLVLVAGGWLGYRGLQAERALRSVGDVVKGLQSDIGAGRTQALADELPTVQADAARARSATSDPVWRLAEHLPGVGDDLAAVRTVAAAVDDVARDALPAIAQLGTVLAAQAHRLTPDRHRAPVGRSSGRRACCRAVVLGTIAVVRSGVPDSAWVGIKYPRAIWDDQDQRGVSDADVAEVAFRRAARPRSRCTL
jgi:hypothetical protein